ncbi:hypothetical protein QTP81_08840 [Alteromonas sp. ASW11-36]|uniref:SGNH hydrolase-type esterase domain-containing protein n=1 Tax=Alteromonas arenosi TaxID=3055817 RepID=A0ABT7SX13_9ALTE|nr:hypothetical protein [Alteromonas sp. ASW11-36]MDM7860701.1 hypothetical protein [Alteromonas sp. ASW11-36]
MKTSPNKLWLFRVILLLLPVLLIVLLEFVLRLVGFGGHPPLFITNPTHQSYLLPRPDIINRYFNDKTNAPRVTLEANFFLNEKPQDSLRLVVQGGSTAAGYPYGLGTSLAAMLDSRLKPTLPGHQVEVINTALSAVNSFTLLDLADEIIAQQPDAVLIYAGHNEFLGIMGVGSNYSIASNYTMTRAVLWLDDLALYQAIQAAVSAFRNPKESDVEPENRRTVMSQVARHKTIARNSARFNAGIEQFKRNMSELIERYHNAGVPVFISTVASNLQHQAPFKSLAVPDEFTRALAQSSKHTISALSNEWQSHNSADLHFTLAQKALALGSELIAKRHFVLAKEHDLLRFRAPTEINNVIKNLAKQTGVYLVDSEAEFAARSPAGITGRNLMLEHLHPNVPGYFVIANAFYDQLRESALFKPWRNFDPNTAWQRRLVLPAEEYYGFAGVLTLMSDYPFTDEPQAVRLPQPQDWQQNLGRQFFAKEIDWLTMMRLSAERYKAQNEHNMYIKTLQILADALPHDPIVNGQVAEQLYNQNRFSEALYYIRRAQRAGDVSPQLERMNQRIIGLK